MVNLERGHMVQVTMPKPYTKYKIIASNRSLEICYEKFPFPQTWKILGHACVKQEVNQW